MDYEHENKITATVTISDPPEDLEEVRERTRLWRALAQLTNTVAWLLIAAAVLAAATAVGFLIDSRTAEAQTASYEGSEVERYVREKAAEHDWLALVLASTDAPRACTDRDLADSRYGLPPDRIAGKALISRRTWCLHPELGWGGEARKTAIHELAHLWWHLCEGSGAGEWEADLLTYSVVRREPWGPGTFAYLRLTDLTDLQADALVERTSRVRSCEPREQRLEAIGETKQLPDLLPWCIMIYQLAGGSDYVEPWQRAMCRQLLVDYREPWPDLRDQPTEREE